MNQITERVAKAFREFAPHCHNNSPLYEQLSLRIAADQELLELAQHVQPGQPPPNMLFAAVHLLLLTKVTHPLAQFYPSAGGTAAPSDATYPLFRSFCAEHRPAITQLLATRRTQTNEVRRCAYLLPSFALVARFGESRPLALVEIGPSAGLNLWWDRYCYSYGDSETYGHADAPVQIATSLRGPDRPPLPRYMPEVTTRLGIDLNPIDLGDTDAVQWLEALVWPEHTERLRLLRAAIAMAHHAPPPVQQGDALEQLPATLASLPQHATRCVYHTHVTYQFSQAMRAQLTALLIAASADRPVYRIGCEGIATADPQLVLTTYASSVATERVLATCHGHGEWIAWVERIG